MSDFSLGESPVTRDPDHNTNAVKHSIESIQTSSPEKDAERSTWLDVFAFYNSAFRILRNLYENPDTESSGLRLMGWSNMFDTLHNRIAVEDEIFSAQNLEKYADEVLQFLVDGAYDLLNQHVGYDPTQISEIEGLYAEVMWDFKSMLDIERAVDEETEMESDEMNAEMEGLVGAVGGFCLEFEDPVQEMDGMFEGMELE